MNFFKPFHAGVSLMFSAAGQLVLAGGPNLFELNFFIKKAFLQMVKPARQNYCIHSQSICPMSSP